MADKSHELAEWISGIKWDKYIYDKEVQVLISQLKDRIEKLASTADGAAGNGQGGYHRIKLVAVGDGAVGKTSLLISYAKGTFPTDYVPTVFENYAAQVKREKDGSPVLLHLWDTAGQEEYDRLRPLSYNGADIVLICFSTVAASTLESVKEKWAPEINHYIPSVPYFLVGTKVDLRDEKKPDPASKHFTPVSKEEGEAMRKQIKAVKYIEVSSKLRLNLEQVFQEAVECVLESRAPLDVSSTSEATDAPIIKKRPKQTCTLL